MDILEKFRKNEYISFPIYSMTRNKAHKDYYRFFKEACNWGSEELSKWQFKKVKDMVQYAYNHVSFYCNLYDKSGISPNDLHDWSDFECIPCVDKTTIKNNEELFHSDENNKLKCRYDYTGGSTGQPMKFLLDEEIYQREDAIYRFYWKQIGFRVGEKCIILRGRKIFSQDNQKIYEYNRFWNYMYLDSAYLSIDYFKLYDQAIKKFCAKVIQAYPSSILMLARLYELKKVTPPKFDIILLGSENIDKIQIEFLKDFFMCTKIYNQYGHSEKATLALQTPSGSSLGFVPIYGYSELLDKSERTISDMEHLGEIVATGFSKSMPLIRYKTGDMAFLSEEKTNDFMKDWKKIKGIEGRLHEFIVTSNGRNISICTIGGAHISELNDIVDMQYEQNAPGDLIVHIVSDSVMPKETLRIIEKKYEDLFNGEINCTLKQVKKLKRTNRNKKIMLIQNIK